MTAFITRSTDRRLLATMLALLVGVQAALAQQIVAVPGTQGIYSISNAGSFAPATFFSGNTSVAQRVDLRSGEVVTYDATSASHGVVALDSGELIVGLGPDAFRTSTGVLRQIVGSASRPGVRFYGAAGSTLYGSTESGAGTLVPALWQDLQPTEFTAVSNALNSQYASAYGMLGGRLVGTYDRGMNRVPTAFSALPDGSGTVDLARIGNLATYVANVNAFGIGGSAVIDAAGNEELAVWSADGLRTRTVSPFNGYASLLNYGMSASGTISFVALGGSADATYGDWGWYDLATGRYGLYEADGYRITFAVMADDGSVAGTLLAQDGSTIGFRRAAAPVPEPATLAALGFGALALLRQRSVRRASA